MLIFHHNGNGLLLLLTCYGLPGKKGLFNKFHAETKEKQALIKLSDDKLDTAFGHRRAGLIYILF